MSELREKILFQMAENRKGIVIGEEALKMYDLIQDANIDVSADSEIRELRASLMLAKMADGIYNQLLK